MEIGSRISLPTKNNFIELVSFQDTLVSSDTLVPFYRTSVNKMILNKKKGINIIASGVVNNKVISTLLNASLLIKVLIILIKYE